MRRIACLCWKAVLWIREDLPEWTDRYVWLFILIIVCACVCATGWVILKLMYLWQVTGGGGR